MGQKDKARRIVSEKYHFDRVVAAGPGDVIAVSDRVAAGIKSRMGGSMAKKGSKANNGGQHVVYQLVGPGGLVSVATAILSAKPVDGGSEVTVELDEYMYQKGSLGMKPTINGAKHLDNFFDGLRTELDLMGRPQ